MTTDQIRAEFEKSFPLPVGVHWNDDHYMGTHDVIGSFSNASIWSHTYRGWRKCMEVLLVDISAIEDSLLSDRRLPRCYRGIGDTDMLIYVESVGFIKNECTDAVDDIPNTPLEEFILAELTKLFDKSSPIYRGPMVSGTGVRSQSK